MPRNILIEERISWLQSWLRYQFIISFILVHLVYLWLLFPLHCWKNKNKKNNSVQSSVTNLSEIYLLIALSELGFLYVKILPVVLVSSLHWKSVRSVFSIGVKFVLVRVVSWVLNFCPYLWLRVSLLPWDFYPRIVFIVWQKILFVVGVETFETKFHCCRVLLSNLVLELSNFFTWFSNMNFGETCW